MFSDFIILPHLLQVGYGRLSVEIFQHAISSCVLGHFRNFAIRVLQVSENQRARWTGLNARRCDLAIADRTSLIFGDIFGPAYPLHAKGAFFHYSLAADSDVWIELHVKRLG